MCVCAFHYRISPVFIEELERIKGKIGDRLELRCKSV